MNWIDNITPKNTEEVRPGLFVQSRPKNPDSISYRVVYPAAWNGKVNWKNFILGHNFFKNLFIFLLILFIAYSYQHDVSMYKEFYEEHVNNPLCNNIIDICTEEMKDNGLCEIQIANIDLTKVVVNDQGE